MLFLLLAQCPRKRMEWRPVRKVLIVRFGTLGESLLVFPILKSLKERLPGVHVEVLTGALPLWIMCPYVDRVVPFRFMSSLITALIRFRSYDVVIDTEPFGDYSAVLSRLFGKTCVGFRTGGRERLYDYSVPFNDQQYEVQTFLDLLQPICGPIRFDELIAPMVDPSLEETDRVAGLLSTDGARIAVNLGSSHGAPQRLWPLDRFAELLMRISRNHRCQFIFVGLQLERELARQIGPLLTGVDFRDCTGSLSLRELCHLLKKADCLISADTGTMHLGAALGIPVFSFFGPNLPIRFAPRNRGSVFFYHPTPSSPCINVHLPAPSTACQCNGECVRSIGVEEVFAAIDGALKQHSVDKSGV
jgi:heptosyltransferase-2